MQHVESSILLVLCLFCLIIVSVCLFFFFDDLTILQGPAKRYVPRAEPRVETMIFDEMNKARLGTPARHPLLFWEFIPEWVWGTETRTKTSHLSCEDGLWLVNLYGKSKPPSTPTSKTLREEMERDGMDRCANPFHSVLVNSDRERRSRAFIHLHILAYSLTVGLSLTKEM